MKAIIVNTNKRDFFRYYLEFLNPLFDLRNRELDVLAELLYWNDHYKENSKEVRQKMVFDYDTKKDIMEHLGLSTESLYNHLGGLRKKGFIGKRKITPKYEIYFDTHNVLAFRFLLNE